MILQVTLENPVGGYWDGGVKSVFEWRIDGAPQTDTKGQYIRVGSWDANQWFNVAVGKTEKITLSNARRKINSTLKKRGIKAKFEYKGGNE